MRDVGVDAPVMAAQSCLVYLVEAL